jgi:hypothetical protein
MSFDIIPTFKFVKEIKRLVKKYPSLKAEYAKLISALFTTPSLGTPLGENCFKIRIAIISKNKGKSGGARVISFVIFKEKTVYLLSVYDKSEKANITQKELKEIVKQIK